MKNGTIFSPIFSQPLFVDISNVLAPFRFKEFLAEKGFDGMTIKRKIKASAMTPYWTEYEKGKLTYEEAMDAFISQI